MLTQSILVTLSLTFCSFQQAYAQINLNPALLGCIMSGGDCLANTGIELIDTLFGGVEVNQDHHKSYEFKKYYFNSGLYWSQFGETACRKAKMDFYIKKTGWVNKPWQDYDTMRGRYLQDYEREKGAEIFYCTDNQREIFIKKLIGDQ